MGETVPVDIRRPGCPTETKSLPVGETIRKALEKAGIKIQPGEEVWLNKQKVDPDKTHIYSPFVGRDNIEINKAQQGAGKPQDLKIIPRDSGA